MRRAHAEAPRPYRRDIVDMVRELRAREVIDDRAGVQALIGQLQQQLGRDADFVTRFEQQFLDVGLQATIHQLVGDYEDYLEVEHGFDREVGRFPRRNFWGEIQPSGKEE